MSKPTGTLLLTLALLATGAIVWWTSGGHREDADGYDLATEDDGPPSGGQEPGEVPTAADAGDPQAERGLPRILPPGAAIEDVRDALALEGKARGEALHRAYAAIGRIAQQPRILRGLVRVVDDDDDARLRGVVIAALGAVRDGTHVAGLALRLESGTSDEERLGALLALAYDPEGAAAVARSLGGLPHRHGALPERGDVRTALASLIGALEGAVALDALDVLEGVVATPFYAQHAAAVGALREKVGER